MGSATRTSNAMVCVWLLQATGRHRFVNSLFICRAYTWWDYERAYKTDIKMDLLSFSKKSDGKNC